MPFSCLLCACFFVALLVLRTDFGTPFIGIRWQQSISLQLLEGKPRCQNETVTKR